MHTPPYPPARREQRVEEVHGERIADPFRWLEDAESVETKEWLSAQADLLDRRRADWSGREHFRERLEALLSTGFHGPPSWRGERQFFTRRTAEQQHGVLHTVDPGGSERVLLDPTAVDPSGSTTLDAWSPSPDGSLLAYQLSESGTEESTIRVLDVATGETVDGPVPRTRFSPVAWLPDGSGFYYVRRLDPAQVPTGEEQYHRRVWLHRLGADPDRDAIVFGAGRAKEFVWGVSLSRDGRWLVVSGARGTDPRNDVYLADLADGDLEAPRFVAVQEDVDARTSVTVEIDGRMYVWTDRDAPRGRLLVADPETPHQWRPLVDEDPGAVLDGYAVLDDLDRPLLAVSWTRHGIAELGLHDLADGGRRRSVELPGLGTVGGLLTRYDGGHELWFSYTDHLTPPRIQRLDARSGTVRT